MFDFFQYRVNRLMRLLLTTTFGELHNGMFLRAAEWKTRRMNVPKQPNQPNVLEWTRHKPSGCGCSTSQEYNARERSKTYLRLITRFPRVNSSDRHQQIYRPSNASVLATHTLVESNIVSASKSLSFRLSNTDAK